MQRVRGRSPYMTRKSLANNVKNNVGIYVSGLIMTALCVRADIFICRGLQQTHTKCLMFNFGNVKKALL